MGRGEEGVTQMELISGRQKQTAHVDRQQVGAVAASYRDSLEQAGARNTHLKHTSIYITKTKTNQCHELIKP